MPMPRTRRALAQSIKDLIMTTVTTMPWTEDDICQLAVNIVDYSDYDYNGSNIRADVRTQLDRPGQTSKTIPRRREDRLYKRNQLPRTLGPH